MRSFHGVGQRNGAEHFVQPPFLDVNLVKLPALAAREFRHAADERAVAATLARISPHDGTAAGFVHYIDFGGERRQLFGERLRVCTMCRKPHGARKIRTRLQFLRRTRGDDAAAIDDDDARAGGFDFFENVRRKYDRLVLDRKSTRLNSSHT